MTMEKEFIRKSIESGRIRHPRTAFDLRFITDWLENEFGLRNAAQNEEYHLCTDRAKLSALVMAEFPGVELEAK